MAISKIILNGVAQIDLTQDTVDIDKLLTSYTAHKNDGTIITGTASSGFTITDESNTSGTTAVIIEGNSGSTPTSTIHEINLEFTDGTDTTILIYHENSFFSNAIKATTPSMYNGKIVEEAKFDGVTWYTRPTGTWETLLEDIITFYDEGNNEDSFAYITELGNVGISSDSIWRITYGNTTRIHTAIYGIPWDGATSQWHINSTTDGTNGPYIIINNTYAWIFGDYQDISTHDAYLKIERLITS